MRPNQTKRRLLQGKAALGTFCLGGSPLLTETLGQAGYDFVIVDCQHGESNPGNLLAMLQAVSCTPATPLVRVTANAPADLQRALDLGAYGLVVPMVNTRAEAEVVLRSVRYAPAGARSWGPIRGGLYGGADYFAKAHEELLVIAMLETAEAVRNAGEILGVPGIDGCFIGPNDSQRRPRLFLRAGRVSAPRRGGHPGDPRCRRGGRQGARDLHAQRRGGEGPAGPGLPVRLHPERLRDGRGGGR